MWARFRCILQMPTPFSTLQRHCTGATFPAFGEVTGKLVLRVIEVTTSQVHMRNTLMLPVVTDAYGGASSCTCVPHTPFTSPLWHTFCKSSATGIASGGALEHAIRIGLLELCVWCHQLGNGKRELGKYSVSPPPIITMGRRIVRYHPPPPHTHTYTLPCTYQPHLLVLRFPRCVLVQNEHFLGSLDSCHFSLSAPPFLRTVCVKIRVTLEYLFAPLLRQWLSLQCTLNRFKLAVRGTLGPTQRAHSGAASDATYVTLFRLGRLRSNILT